MKPRKKPKSLTVWLTRDQGIEGNINIHDTKPTYEENFGGEVWLYGIYEFCHYEFRRIVPLSKFRGNKILKGRIIFEEEKENENERQ